MLRLTLGRTQRRFKKASVTSAIRAEAEPRLPDPLTSKIDLKQTMSFAVSYLMRVVIYEIIRIYIPD